MGKLDLTGKTTILFDLDGTLLPMELEAFTNTYFSLLAKKAAPFGYEAKPLIAAVWQGTKGMIANDGSRTNCDCFWEIFSQVLGKQVLSLKPEFDDFYAHEFHYAKSSTGENPLAKKVICGLKEKGYEIVLATNPIFPKVGVATRLSWIGLDFEDFSYVTTYENSSFCKPNPLYFQEILSKLQKRPEECLMVGNDATEDSAAEMVGVPVYLVTDCLVNSKQKDLSHTAMGSFTDLPALFGIS